MYFYRLVMLVAITSLLMSGCASLPDPHVRITFPANGAVITVSDDVSGLGVTPVRITFSVDTIPPTNDSSCRDLSIGVEPYDNGGSIGELWTGSPFGPPITISCSSSAPSPEQNLSQDWVPPSLGLHTLSAHVIVTNDAGARQVFDTNSITICVVGDPLHPPHNIPVGLVTANCNPNPPTPTPVPPVIIRPNPHNPGGTNPSGCAALTNQTDCNLAGCSWNPQNSTCSVNP